MSSLIRYSAHNLPTGLPQPNGTPAERASDCSVDWIVGEGLDPFYRDPKAHAKDPAACLACLGGGRG